MTVKITDHSLEWKDFTCKEDLPDFKYIRISNGDLEVQAIYMPVRNEIMILDDTGLVLPDDFFEGAKWIGCKGYG